MDLKVIYKNARCAILEIENGGTYKASRTYRIYLDEEFIWETGKAVASIYNLEPDTDYQMGTRSGDSLVFETFFTTDNEYVTLNVRDSGVKGDGIQDDTLFIQAAVMAYLEKSRVLVPAGAYRIVSLSLKDSTDTELTGGAVLSAYTDQTRFPVFQGIVQGYDEQGKYSLGIWEGSSLSMFTGIITGMNVKETVIYRQGIIDRNTRADEGNWWHESRVIRAACRPRMILLERYRQVMVQGITVGNSPNWNIRPHFSDHLRFFDLGVLSPKGSPNMDRLDPELYKDVEIAGICFSVGDSCVAIGSGKIYMDSTYKCPSKNISIRRYCIWDGHGSITIGGKMAGGVKDLAVKNCMFLRMDRGLRIKTRRGRGKNAMVDKIVFKHIRMDRVMTPFVINCFYSCDPDGHSEYVHAKEALPVDDETPFIKSLCSRDIEAENCHVAAAYMYGLPEQWIGRVEMGRVRVSYAALTRGGQPAMMDGCGSYICRVRIYTNQVEELALKGVKVEGQDDPAIVTENIGCICGNI